MEIPAKLVKELRERTGAGFADCRAALVEANGVIEKAIEILRKKGQAAAAKKAQREASEGLVGSYIHAGGKIGVWRARKPSKCFRMTSPCTSRRSILATCGARK